MLALVFEAVSELVADVLPYRAGDADPAGLRERLQPGGDVDAVAINVAALGDHIAEVDADPKGDPLIVGDIGIAVEHRPLQLDGTANRLYDASPVVLTIRP